MTSLSNGSVSSPEKSKGSPRGDFLRQIVDLIVSEIVETTADRDSRVVEFVHPAELSRRLDLSIPTEGVPDSELVERCRDTIKYSVKTGHAHFFNQLFQGSSQYGLAGAWLSDALNTSQYTYEVAPVFTLLEQEVLSHMAKIIGYESWDGIFCPGGSISNIYGLHLARFHKYPQIKEEGMQALPKVRIFTSEQSHYSLKKGVSLLGMGLKCVETVSCDSAGRLIPEKLEEAVVKSKQEGFEAMFVHATSGTTVAGAFDPLDDVAEICTNHNIWLHVDACWGGGALLSRKHKHLLRGIHRADSVAWNPHKMMGAPLQCCAFLTKHEDLLKQCNCANATYLFQSDKFYDVSYDTGDKSVQCGRKVDVFKLWLMWKAKGDMGFERDIDNMFDNAEYLTKKLRTADNFRLVFPKPECTNVCFWYIPQSLRGQEESAEWWSKMEKVAPIIKEQMALAGTLLIGYQPLGAKVNFFRMVIANPEVTPDDMDFVLNEIHRIGKDIVLQ